MQALQQRAQELEDKRYHEACDRMAERLSDAELSRLEALAVLTDGGENEQVLSEDDRRFLDKLEAMVAQFEW